MSQEETNAEVPAPSPGALLTLSSPGLRTVPVTVGEARQIRARWLQEISDASPNSQVVKIDIGCRVWSPDALRALLGDASAAVDDESSLAYLLGKFHTTLQVLKVDDITATLPTELGLESLRCISDAFAKFEWPHLHTLNLNDTAIGTRGIEALDSLWRIPALRHLHLQNIGLSAESIDMFVKHLLPPETSSASESEPAETANEESELPQRLVPFQTLSLGRNMLGIAGSRGVSQLLRSCHQLENLDYAGCRPQGEGARHVAAGLVASGSHSTIRVLNLNDGELKSGVNDDDPVHLVAHYVSQSTQLDTLIVSDSSLSSRGVKLLLDAVMSSPSSSNTLRHLDIGYNVDDDDDDDEDDDGGDDDDDEEGGGGGATSPPSIRCATAVAHAVMKLPNLRQLHLHNNDLKDEGVGIVVKALAARGGGTTEAGGTSGIAPLDVLNLCENNLESVDMLLENPIEGLRELRLADNLDLEDNMDDDQRERLDAMYPTVVWELVEEAFDVGPTASAAALAAAAPALPATAAGAVATTTDDVDDDALAKALGGVHLG